MTYYTLQRILPLIRMVILLGQFWSQMNENVSWSKSTSRNGIFRMRYPRTMKQRLVIIKSSAACFISNYTKAFYCCRWVLSVEKLCFFRVAPMTLRLIRARAIPSMTQVGWRNDFCKNSSSEWWINIGDFMRKSSWFIPYFGILNYFIATVKALQTKPSELCHNLLWGQRFIILFLNVERDRVSKIFSRWKSAICLGVKTDRWDQRLM